MRKFTPAETEKLQKAYELISDVQVAMAKKIANGSEWEKLFEIRQKLGQELYYRKAPQ